MKFFLFFLLCLPVLSFCLAGLAILALVPASARAAYYHPFDFPARKTEIILGKSAGEGQYIRYHYEF